jgi:hypothetical protein
LVTASVLPETPKVALPPTTMPPVGLACTLDEKHEATARARTLALH